MRRAVEVTQGGRDLAISKSQYGADQASGIEQAVEAAEHATMLLLDSDLGNVWEVLSWHFLDERAALDYLVQSQFS